MPEIPSCNALHWLLTYMLQLCNTVTICQWWHKMLMTHKPKSQFSIYQVTYESEMSKKEISSFSPFWLCSENEVKPTGIFSLLPGGTDKKEGNCVDSIIRALLIKFKIQIFHLVLHFFRAWSSAQHHDAVLLSYIHIGDTRWHKTSFPLMGS